MSFIPQTTCRRCQRRFSALRSRCPHCGARKEESPGRAQPTTEQAQTLVNDVLPIGAWHKANTIDDLLLSTWSVGDVKAKDYDTSLYINTWSIEGNNDGSEFKAPFFEYWTGDGNSLGAKTMTATACCETDETARK